MTPEEKVLAGRLRRMGEREGWEVSDVDFIKSPCMGQFIVRAKITNGGKVKWLNSLLSNHNPPKEWVEDAAAQMKAAFNQ